MTHGYHMPHYSMPRFHFSTPRSTHFGIGYNSHSGTWHIPCRHTPYNARRPADHPHYRPLTLHWNNLLRLCFGGAGHGWFR
jgi:hypothetical protein